ncbi:hypothetical protein EPJ64_03855 [Brachyspira aalborgi]|jgi:hypothetical protein|uniref:Uncharacterized protein n=1 Tax=Brachyspira aalborgi TaxID=29522 RepID=A0AB38Q1S8_9SPIR|nr:hypothetical protein [Brachyspira aalborgi]CCY75209.1 putative uncharacterized protein [Brachyspira sp. CAG:700]TXJ16232.1 hypothetical protein EPJ77_03870 [Brachyspira aalborgi]TXJ21863.1 hypothetical protein EPJ64_03855 [Brachyspira aalborgi]TXJ26529.1 hypothetical protein EPJ73_04285 [Brachyspira aalborgi]TXJ33363.1 hypothetical protein EPJ71_03795 [Brachyspira aalborgi]
METVYFDSQIFRELKKEENKYLLDKILKLKNNKLKYVYFDAHIYDLQNDKTDKKIEDLKFMSRIVENNYMLFDINTNSFIKNETNIENNYNYFYDFNSLFSLDYFNIFSLFNNIQGEEIDTELNPLFELLNNILQIIKNLKIPLNFEYRLSEEENNFIQKFIPNCDNPTIGEIATTTNNTLKNYFENIKSYREDRKDIKNILGNNNKDMVYKSINNILKLDIDIKFKFIAIYNMLDMLSEISEKTSKLKYRNMTIDAMHSFNSMSSDYFITNDNKLMLKSKELYKIINYNEDLNINKIQTTAMSLEEFINIIDNIN